MTLVKIGKVEDVDTMLDIAFRRARERREMSHSTIKGRSDISRLDKSRRAEKQRVLGAGKSLRGQLDAIEAAFPSFNQLAPFYQELVRTVLDLDELKRSLGAVRWVSDKIGGLTKDSVRRIDACVELTKINAIRREHYGRCASTLKQIGKDLISLDKARKTLKDLPTIKTSVPTVVIAGIPNVGKSTLLSALTGAKPAIQPYPFTTRHLMLGYANIDGKQVQFIDTPGILDRPASDRNPIERRAALAIRHLAKLILFVIDPTLHSGFSVEEQLSLLKDLRKEFDAPFVVLVNKADLMTSDIKIPGVRLVRIAAKTKQGLEGVLDAIKPVLRESDVVQGGLDL